MPHIPNAARCRRSQQLSRPLIMEAGRQAATSCSTARLGIRCRVSTGFVCVTALRESKSPSGCDAFAVEVPTNTFRSLRAKPCITLYPTRGFSLRALSRRRVPTLLLDDGCPPFLCHIRVAANFDPVSKQYTLPGLQYDWLLHCVGLSLVSCAHLGGRLRSLGVYNNERDCLAGQHDRELQSRHRFRPSGGQRPYGERDCKLLSRVIFKRRRVGESCSAVQLVRRLHQLELRNDICRTHQGGCVGRGGGNRDSPKLDCNRLLHGSPIINDELSRPPYGDPCVRLRSHYLFERRRLGWQCLRVYDGRRVPHHGRCESRHV